MGIATIVAHLWQPTESNDVVSWYPSVGPIFAYVPLAVLQQEKKQLWFSIMSAIETYKEKTNLILLTNQK